MTRLLFFVPVLLLSGACSQTEETKISSKKSFVFRERMITGTDTAMVPLKENADAVLAQQWYLDDVSAVSTDSLVWVDGNGARLFPSLNLFSDGTFTENPRGAIKTGKWKRVINHNVNNINIHYDDGTRKEYRIRLLSFRNLTISWKDGKDSFWIRFRSDGIRHQNELNDPYHPFNNTWRIPPAKAETDSLLLARIKKCVRFYALYYRDNIKRKKKSIEFGRLPTVFIWYSGGIGLPDKNEVEDDWVNCFYNKEQALAGYDILKELIVDNEFDWPTGTPSWNYRTLSVLEQMYAAL